MHRPGHVQGGQEASFGYLLLGVYYRRIPGETLHVLSNYSAVQKCIYTIEQKSKASDSKGLLGGKGASNKMQIGETVGETSGGKKRNKMTDQTSREGTTWQPRKQSCESNVQ